MEYGKDSGTQPLQGSDGSFVGGNNNWTYFDFIPVKTIAEVTASDAYVFQSIQMSSRMGACCELQWVRRMRLAVF